MKHLGDITKISGYDAPIVDCIIGGSPCQDLSVAGKRAGLDGERSGLYMEQIRIVKEMREQDERNGRTGVDIRPRYMVWENVPGAFSSNKGEDFRIVLEELAKVADKDAVIPRPADGKWRNSGCIMGRGWSIAWRVLDAQFWGTSDKPLPQRRRRIALVADFGGESAPEILFVSEGVSGHTQPGEPKRKETPSDASRGIGANDSLGADQYNAVILGDTVSTLGVNCGMSHGRQCVLEPMAYGISSYDSNAMKSPNPNSGIYEAETSRTLDGNGGNPACNQGGIAVVEPIPYTLKIRGGVEVDSMGKAPTLTTTHDGAPAVCYGINGDKAGTLDASYYKGCGMREGKERDVVVQAVDCRNGTEDDVNGALQSNSAHSLNGNNVVRTRYIVRRLTPLECERLQGYPDNWTRIGEVIGYERQADESGNEYVQAIYEYIDANGKKRKTSDAARYRALGNSIALPPWKWVLKRLCACYERDATMASLFDGIGGFPYLWEQLNGKGSCLWASEVEEFCIAVTKKRIGE